MLRIEELRTKELRTNAVVQVCKFTVKRRRSCKTRGTYRQLQLGLQREDQFNDALHIMFKTDI